jgi:hypothetical protein
LTTPDPQRLDVYRAQSDVAHAHPELDILDLATARAYVATITAAESLTISGCYRIWRFAGGADDDFVVDRSMADRDLAGVSLPHPVTGAAVVLIPWTDRYSGFDVDYNEIDLGGPPNRPLSHQLLLVHEISHVIKQTEEQHGPEWVQAFLSLTGRAPPNLRAELEVALRAYGVAWR